MIESSFDSIDKLIGSLEKLGAISMAAFRTLIEIGMGYYIWINYKERKESNDNWRLTRENQIKAEEHQTTTMNDLVKSQVMVVDSLNNLLGHVKTLSIQIDERIPKKQ